MADTAAEEEGRRVVAALQAELGKVILGKPAVIDDLLAALLGGGHILMEDVPGVGKTTLAKALAFSFAAEFKRVQFTPDLLPTDILGSSVYSPRDGSFTFKPGPIFTNVHRAPLEHVRALTAFPAEAQAACARAVDCFYAARFGRRYLPAAEVAHIRAEMDRTLGTP